MVIVCFVDIGVIDDYHCLEVIVCFVDIGGIDDHHCLGVIVRFVDIGGINDHHCLLIIFRTIIRKVWKILKRISDPVNRRTANSIATKKRQTMKYNTLHLKRKTNN
jgi:hypothetical protein